MLQIVGVRQCLTLYNILMCLVKIQILTLDKFKLLHYKNVTPELIGVTSSPKMMYYTQDYYQVNTQNFSLSKES
ncbi:hypothetical protein NIES22_09260 [Calothrix brevissima NIES-22]|nr:hypothetical protein NIES22_09260 [Calothrix brevissima NIES-22]